ncbi:protease inhibitor I42 family protein [Clostridium uliginosum]|uniref:Inhibitor of cysteine peptidase n=1 Tax=Clostridium uliginosum TaxID=119641 RepID=A0A1I1NN41_9CLOT|nr:protease inhibitor I42 family protein [Clostridium uliginosum]SFC99071.1 inhibitor of cysteine peptidase [Clostridium uliginosum]
MKKLKILLVSVLATISILTISSKGVNAEWKHSSTGWWYSEENSYATEWKQIDGVWYYFDENGYMKKGWLYDNGTWYYTASNGAMQTGIIQVDGKTYYLALSGAMQTGNVIIDEETYSFAMSGAAIGDKIPQTTKAFLGEGITTEPIQTKDTSKIGEKTVEINLQGNPTTGYNWDYHIDTDGIINEDSKQYKQDDANLDVVGAGGTYTWKFSALKEGTTEITFKYYRPWENEAIQTKTYIFTVDKELKITVKEK